MSTMLTCPKGHQWEAAADGASGPPAGISCPVCGTVVSPALEETKVYVPGGPKGPEPAPVPSTVSWTEKAGEIQEKVAAWRPAAAASEWPEVEGFEIFRELGRGGMGVVYQARQISLNRNVALKMILSGAHAGGDDLRRFQTEAEAVAQLQHPNLVSIYGVGVHENRPYFSLEFVDGGNLDDKFDGKPQPPQKAAQLTETLARAMHYAHERGIVHRDLKPGNVLLTRDGTPKITDFGLAKRMDSAKGQTQTGAIMGTPSYMAPEQAAGRGKDIGPHTDVYSLGSMLYEFLTGRPPFLAESSWDTIVQVANQEPLPPSRLQPRIPRDLETICLKCLEKEPRKRYPSALALAEDLARFLAHEPIQARSIGLSGRLIKWVKRRPAVAALTALSLAALLLLLIFGSSYHLRLQKFAGELQKANEENHRRLVQLNVASGTHHLDNENAYVALVWFVEALNKDRDHPERAAIHRMRLAAVLRECPRIAQIWFHQAAVRHASFSPDGKRVATSSEDGTAQVWDVQSGERILQFKHGATVWQAWFSPDGERVLTCSGDGTARLWDAVSGIALSEPFRHSSASLPFDQPTCASFSPDGRWVLTAGYDHQAIVWDTATGKQLSPPMPHAKTVRWAAFSPDGKRIVTAGNDNTARIWDSATHQQIGRDLKHAEGEPVTFACFSPDNQLVATAGDDDTARLWNAATGDHLKTLKHNENVNWAAFSSDSKSLLTASDDHTARIWDTGTGVMLTPSLEHGSSVRRYAAFSSDGCVALTASDDNYARLWYTRTGKPFTANLIHNGTVHCAVFSPDRRYVATVSSDHTACLWDLATGSLLSSTTPLSEEEKAEAARPKRFLSSDGRREIVVNGNSARVKDVSTGALTVPMQHENRIIHAAFSPDGLWVVTTSADNNVQVWDAATGQARYREPLEHGSAVEHAAFSADGKFLITACGDNRARIWDAAAGEMAAQPLMHHGTVRHVVFSPDGRLAATASDDHTARVWDAATGAAVTPFLAHPFEVREVQFSSDSRRLLTTCKDQKRREWDLPTEDRPVEDLLKLIHFLAANQINEKGAYRAMHLKDLKSLWKELKGKHPEVSFAGEAETRAWKERVQEECKAER